MSFGIFPAVKPLLKNETNQKIEEIENEEELLKQINDLKCILTKDGREISPENKECIENNKKYVINIFEDCHDFEPRDWLPRSSTMMYLFLLVLQCLCLSYWEIRSGIFSIPLLKNHLFEIPKKRFFKSLIKFNVKIFFE